MEEENATLSANEAARAAEQAIRGPQDLDGYIEFILQVLQDGGWVMIPLFLLTLYIYFEASSLILLLYRTRVKKVTPSTLAQWVEDPSKSHGHAGQVVRYVMGGEQVDHESILNRLSGARQRVIPKVNQRIVLLSVLVTIAPLMGLLGTVIGMLGTFKAMSIATGQTIDLVAEGISVALITTQTGLMVAIPGYLCISHVIKKRNEYNAFLSQLESVALQLIARKDQAA